MEIAKIALWSHKDQNDRYNCIDENFNETKLEELPDKLQNCEYVSLLWDDMSMLVDLKKELEI